MAGGEGVVKGLCCKKIITGTQKGRAEGGREEGRDRGKEGSTMVVHTCNPGTQGARRETLAQGQPELHSKINLGVGYTSNGAV